MEPDNNVTQIPVVDAPVDDPVVDNPVDNPSPPEVAADPQVDVPGTPPVPVEVGEHLGEPQPAAPNPVPAVSGVDTDAVSVNRYLEDVEQKITEVKNYVQTFLAAHELSKEVLTELETLVEKVKNGKI